jgi:alpha-L-fucosidase
MAMQTTLRARFRFSCNLARAPTIDGDRTADQNDLVNNDAAARTDTVWPDPVPPKDDQAELARVERVIAAGPFAATWESLADYQVPTWFRDAKFGVFLHWGAYTVPAFGNEWYPRNMYLEGSPEFAHHRDTYGPHSDFGYKDFLPKFTAEHWDPQAWASLFKRAGAQFVVPVAEHHDGLAMYETERSRWKTTTIGPHRDIVGDLGRAVRDQWLVLGVSSHRAEHWFFLNGGTRFDSDVTDPEFADFYGPAQREELSPNDAYLIDWFLRTVELIDRYQPQVLWFDWWIEQPAFEPWLRKLAAYYYNIAAGWGRGVVIQHKWKAFAPGTAVLDLERGAMASVYPDVWQNDTSVGRTSWSWIPDQQYKTLAELIAELVDVVAKNGVLLLNIGPKSDGTIAEEEQPGHLRFPPVGDRGRGPDRPGGRILRRQRRTAIHQRRHSLHRPGKVRQPATVRDPARLARRRCRSDRGVRHSSRAHGCRNRISATARSRR